MLAPNKSPGRLTLIDWMAVAAAVLVFLAMGWNFARSFGLW